MKLRPSVVAVLLAFSMAPAWAADSDNAVQDASPTQAVGNAPSSNLENGADAQSGWQYLNGQTQAEASGSASGADQAANAQSAGSDDPSGTGSDDQSANSKDSSGDDQAAMSEETSGSDQSAASGNGSSETDQAASAEDAGGDDQAAMSDDASGGDQTANADNESENDQTAEASDSVGDDHMAMAEPRTHAGTFKPATLEDFKAATQDKLVIILPTGWQGSVPDLISSLQRQSDTEILILSQDDPDDDSDE